MRVCVLSSGSKGNCSYIETKRHKILIDIGNSSAYVERSLRSIGVEPNEIDMILITHAHVDHIAGLRVFSKKYLDFGTRTLLEVIDISNIKGDVLDFGCGYGTIGIIVKSNCECNVDMVDINNRAINLSIKNAKLNRVDVNIFESDIYSNVNKKYDFIITNPPVRVGKKILYEILFGAKDYMKEDGSLYLVINKDQGAKSLKKDLEE